MYFHTLCGKVYFYHSTRGCATLPPVDISGTPGRAQNSLKIVLKNSKENTRNREPQGIPKSTQNRPKKAKKWLQGALWKPLGKDVEKATISGPLWTVKMRLAPRRQLDFHFSQGLPKSSKNGAKMDPKGSQIPPKTPRSRSKSVPEKYTKNHPEIGTKREPTWTPNGSQNGFKIDSGRGPGAEGVRQGSPRPSQGAFWDHFGDF